MHISEINVGDLVLIASSGSTDSNHGWNGDMDQYLNTEQVVSKVDRQDEIVLLQSTNGYFWHPGDLQPIDEIDDLSVHGKKQSFDVNELNVGISE